MAALQRRRHDALDLDLASKASVRGVAGEVIARGLPLHALVCNAGLQFNSGPQLSGDGYELTMGRWSRGLALAFLDFIGAADSQRVLDVGCGTGHLAAAIAARSPAAEIHAVDLSSVYVDYAGLRYPEFQLKMMGI